MATKFPGRPESHVLERAAEAFFESALPHAWVKDKPDHDYGTDYRITIAAGGMVSARSFLVQLKGTANAAPGEFVPIVLKISTYNYLWEQLEVAILVAYVAEEKEAYWIRLADVPEPDQGQDTFTVRVPRANRLSAQPWPEIESYVVHVSKTKLDAMRKARAEAKSTSGNA